MRDWRDLWNRADSYRVYIIRPAAIVNNVYSLCIPHGVHLIFMPFSREHIQVQAVFLHAGPCYVNPPSQALLPYISTTRTGFLIPTYHRDRLSYSRDVSFPERP